jgi:DNA repair exonuclease SbcCD ATPase subunit
VPHRELDLDFSNVEGVIGFAGGNGTGKTMALEIAPMTLYGKSPSGRNLYELMMDDSADMETRFTSSSKYYRAHRILKRKGSTVTQDVYLYELPEPDADGILLAGPKQAEFNAKIEELVGSEDLFLAMTFSAQGAAGDITQVPPRLRKEILGTFVGADRFVPIWEMAKADLATTERESDTTAARITILEQEAVKLQELDVSIADLDRKLTEHEVQVQVTEADLEAARGKVNEWTKLETERDQTQERINRETTEANTVKERIASIGKDGKERGELRDQVNGATAYRKTIADADALIEQRRILTDELRGFTGAEHHARQTYTEAKAAEDKQMEYFKRQRDEVDTLLKRNEKLASRLNDPDLGCPVDKFMVDATEADDGLVEIRRTLRHMQKACETRDPKLGAATDKAREGLDTARECLEYHQEQIDKLTDLSTLDERNT